MVVPTRVRRTAHNAAAADGDPLAVQRSRTERYKYNRNTTNTHYYIIYDRCDCFIDGPSPNATRPPERYNNIIVYDTHIIYNIYIHIVYTYIYICIYYNIVVVVVVI